MVLVCCSSMLLTGVPLVIWHSYRFSSLLRASYWFAWWPQSLRVVSALVLVTHSPSGLFLPWCWSRTATVPQGCPTGMSLPSVGHPRAAGCPLFDMEVLPPRVHLQPHISTAVFPSICLPKNLPCASPVCNGCWSSWNMSDPGCCGILCLAELWGVVVTHTSFSRGWTQLWLALGSSRLPSTPVPTAAPTAGIQSCMPHAWGNLSQVRLRDKETNFFSGSGQTVEKGCSTQGRHTRSKGIAEIHLSLYR